MARLRRNCRLLSRITRWIPGGIRSTNIPRCSPLRTRAVSSLSRSPSWWGESSGELTGSMLQTNYKWLCEYDFMVVLKRYTIHFRYLCKYYQRRNFYQKNLLKYCRLCKCLEKIFVGDLAIFAEFNFFFKSHVLWPMQSLYAVNSAILISRCELDFTRVQWLA